ncbi:uncharacterized protein LOC130954100 [Arachis stenosperma]|uniref:uncharacterized protein LOC130954100 n=1 Tax=Arachis stenosperma TaxID=217475 RepID=UPI0025AD070A|nr:uncharacterized protein LOC130954100 [Arachis stenosperma]
MSMRPFLPKCLFFSSSPARALLLLPLQLSQFSSSSHSPSYHPRRLEEESRHVRVSVWWDFENCQVPNTINVSKIATVITEAVRANGIKGPVHITAFGDVLQLSRSNQEALSYTGIHLAHVPNGGKNSADRSLLIDLMCWVSQNPPPAHLFLISGDKDFAGILHRLRMNNYNILLATPGSASDVLCAAATIMWHWPSLLKGEELIGKHFNHPPDGPVGSWYGNYKVPLENPFSASEQSASYQKAESCESPPIPKSVARQVRKILSSHPKGMSITDFRAELAKNNVQLEKSFYGQKKFSRFLLSIPHVQLKHCEGVYFVCLAPSEFPKPLASNDGPSKTPAVGNETPQKLNGESKNMPRDADRTPSMPSLHERSSEKIGNMTDARLSKVQLPQKDKEVSQFKADNEIVTPDEIGLNKSGKPTSSDDHSAQNTLVENNLVDDESGKYIAEYKNEGPTRGDADEVCQSSYSLPVDDFMVDKRHGGSVETHSKSSIFGWIRSWFPFWKRDAKSDDLTTNNTSMDSHSEFEEPKLSQLDMAVSHSEEPKLCQPEMDVSHSEEPKLCQPDMAISHSEEPKLSQVDETINHSEESKLSEQNQSVIHAEESKISDQAPMLSEPNQIVSHSVETKLCDRDQTVSQSVEANTSEVNQNVGHSDKPKLFFRDSFWNYMESFVFTTQGSVLVSLSTSREDLAQKLQKGGPAVLKSLTEKDILQLIDLLIADKKWLEVSSSTEYPFKVTRPVQKNSSMGLSHGANGLRSLFLNRTSQSNLQKLLEHDAEKHNQNTPHTSVLKLATEKLYAERSRNDILVDCQKVVDEILRIHPEGYNIGCFRKLFYEMCGYHINLQKLGYKNLASLLQTMQGAKLESTNIFPSVPADVCYSDRETSILKTQVTRASHAVAYSDSELSGSAPKDDSMDSPWEELGPISANNSDQSDVESELSRNAKELDTSKYPDYEPVGLDYDPSESEEDSSCLTQPEEQGKPRCNEQDSSLLKVLDFWHCRKEGENSAKNSDGVDIFNNDSLKRILNPSGESSQGALSKIPSGNYKEKHSSRKSYSFVADPLLSPKDKLIDGMLDGFKKTDESKMQN